MRRALFMEPAKLHAKCAARCVLSGKLHKLGFFLSGIVRSAIRIICNPILSYREWEENRLFKQMIHVRQAIDELHERTVRGVAKNDIQAGDVVYLDAKGNAHGYNPRAGILTLEEILDQPAKPGSELLDGFLRRKVVHIPAENTKRTIEEFINSRQ